VTETVVENTPKHTTDDLGIIFFRGIMPQHDHRIFSHAQVHQSLDSYVYVIKRQWKDP